MKFKTLALATALATTAVLPSALAQSSDMIPGQVTKIDESAQKMTVKHGPIKKFDMNDPSMTMVFHVGDPAMLKQVKVGDKIRFVPDRINGQFTIVKLEKVK
jgi:Cu/Ag efflux protein CusF